MSDDDGADLTWLRVAALAEAISLVVLLVNLATAHYETVTSAVGPVHGFAYLATIGAGLLLPLRRSSRLMTLVPGVGGLLALRNAAREPAGR